MVPAAVRSQNILKKEKPHKQPFKWKRGRRRYTNFVSTRRNNNNYRNNKTNCRFVLLFINLLFIDTHKIKKNKKHAGKNQVLTFSNFGALGYAPIFFGNKTASPRLFGKSRDNTANTRKGVSPSPHGIYFFFCDFFFLSHAPQDISDSTLKKTKQKTTTHPFNDYNFILT